MLALAGRYRAQARSANAADAVALNAKAVECYLQHYNKKPSPSKLNLHGLFVKESEKAVSEKLEEWLAAKSPKNLLIICGRGRGSKNGVPKLLGAVKRLVEAWPKRLSYRERTGMIVVHKFTSWKPLRRSRSRDLVSKSSGNTLRRIATRKASVLSFFDVVRVFQGLPTSELIRFVSNNARPILGSFWGSGLDFVLEERLPLSIRTKTIILPDGSANSYESFLYDSQLAEVARIARPELFRFSPLCKLTEKIALLGRNHSFDLHHVVDGSMVAALSNLTSLELTLNKRFENLPRISKWRPSGERFSHGVQHLLPQLKSFTLNGSALSQREILNLLDVLLEMNGLGKLTAPYEVFTAGMPAVVPFAHPFASFALGRDMGGVISRLHTLKMGCYSLSEEHTFASKHDSQPMRLILQFLGSNCCQLRELTIHVVVPIAFYFAAFRRMTKLRKLGLNLYYAARLDLLVADDEPVVDSVTDLRLTFFAPCQDVSAVSAILAKLPNVSTCVIQSMRPETQPEAILFAWQLSSQRVFLRLQHLKVFSYGNRALCKVPSRLFLEFIKIPQLPRSVDLSQIYFEFMIGESSFLGHVYREMRRNSIEYLAMAGAVHRDALPFLRSLLQAELSVHGRSGKFVAWREAGFCRCVPRPQNASEFTDFKIVGKKTSGPLKGQQFTVRIFHEHKAWIDVGDEEAVCCQQR